MLGKCVCRLYVVDATFGCLLILILISAVVNVEEIADGNEERVG